MYYRIAGNFHENPVFPPEEIYVVLIFAFCECKKALTVLGAEKSSDPQVQKANSLCDVYLGKSPEEIYVVLMGVFSMSY